MGGYEDNMAIEDTDNQGVPEGGQVESGPKNLEDAFRTIRAEGSGSDQPDMGQEDPGSGPEEGGGSLDNNFEESGQTEDTAVYDGGPSDVGGSPDAAVESDEGYGYTEVDYSQVNKNLMESATRQAAMDANRFFHQQGITKASINQLYQRDEDGRVTFINPDDPHNPFMSRAEAQQWIDAYNNQVDAEWRNYAQNLQRQYMNDTAPAVRLINFAPKYDALDNKTKQVFDMIVEPYTVKDSTGMEIGYSCDLDAALQQATRMVSVFGSSQAATQQQQQPVQKVATGPALDAVTTGSGTDKGGKAEPKNLADAFRMIQAEKHANKKGNK